MNQIRKLFPLFVCIGIMLLALFILQRDSARVEEENKNVNEVNTVKIKKFVLDSLTIVYNRKTNFKLTTEIISSNIFSLKITNLNSPADFLGKDYKTSGIKNSDVTSKDGYKVSVSEKSPYDVTFESEIKNGFVNIPVAILFKLIEQ